MDIKCYISEIKKGNFRCNFPKTIKRESYLKNFFLFFLAFITAFTTGCPQNSPKLDLSNNNHKNLLVGQLKQNVYQEEWKQYQCAANGYYNGGVDKDGKLLAVGDCPAKIVQTPQNATRIRNEVLDNGVGLIDSAYGVYIRDIRAKRSVQEFLADLLLIGGSTAGGIVKGERSLQIIGVALTGFTGVRKSANLNFYDEKTTSVLIKKMDASRSQVLSEIKQSQAKSLEYTFDAALGDLVRYFDAGTLNRAFTELDKDASVQSEIARRGVLNIKGLQDISAIPTLEEAQNTTDIFTKLKTLSALLGDTTKRDTAIGILKSTYDQIVEGKKFDDILTNLKAGNDSGQLPEKLKKEVIESFKKLDEKKPLTGEEYLHLVQAVLNQTNVQNDKGIVNKPELRKELLNYIKNTEVK